MYGLEDNVALVTGGARGIGAAIAEALAAAGATVAIGDVDAGGAANTATRIADVHGARVIGTELDVTSRAGVERAVGVVEDTLGGVDVLVNNAGIDVIGPFVDSHEADWDRIIAVNLKGMLHCCQVVLRGMIERNRGSIVSMASDAGRVGSSGEAVYSATKGGVIAFTKTLARETARYGIRVNCVCPGPTDTALLAQIAETSPKLHDSLERSIPMRRVAQPDDLAPAVVFLAGDGARYVTGQTLSVSGGLTMS